MAASRLPARVVETITRRELVGLGNGAFALVDRKKVDAAWFSYRLQLQTLLERLRVDLVIDVGANHGQFGQWTRRSYAGTIVSFEPVSANFEALSSAAASDPNWQVQQAGTGRRGRRAGDPHPRTGRLQLVPRRQRLRHRALRRRDGAEQGRTGRGQAPG